MKPPEPLPTSLDLNETSTHNNEAVSKANIPELVSQIIELIDKREMSPNREIISNTYDGAIVAFCAFPTLFRQYFELTGTVPQTIHVQTSELESRTGSKEKYISVSVTCEDGSTIKVDTQSEATDNIVTMNSAVAEFDEKYTVTDNEIGEILMALTLRPNDLEDITLARLDTDKIQDLNPKDPMMFRLLSSALQTQASSTEKARKHFFAFYDSNDWPIELSMQTGTYSDGSDWHMIEVNQEYEEEGQTSKLHLETKNTREGNKSPNDSPHIIDGYCSVAGTDASNTDIDPTIAGIYIETILERARDYPGSLVQRQIIPKQP